MSFFDSNILSVYNNIRNASPSTSHNFAILKLAVNPNNNQLRDSYDQKVQTHNNSIFLGRTNGDPFACLVVEYDKCLSDQAIEKVFGKGVFLGGGVSPDDKEQMYIDCFYVE